MCRLAVIVAAFALFVPEASGQQFDRRSRDEPEVVLHSGGRWGTCDELRFGPDGRFLFAAGDDKVIHVWPYSVTRGLDTTAGKARTLRWRSWRDQLGGIKAVGISPDGKRVAVGGYGLKISSVAIIDRDALDQGKTLAITWPKTGDGDSNFDAVMAIAFHPDGKRIGFGTADGSLWFWDPVKSSQPKDGWVWNPPVRVGRFREKKNARGETTYNFPRGIHFPDADTLVSVSNFGQVLACAVNVPVPADPTNTGLEGKTLFEVNAGLEPVDRYPINGVAWSGDGRWLLAATRGPLVLLRSATDDRVIPIRLPVDHFPRSIAIHPRTGQVAIGVASALPAAPGESRFYREANDEIWLYDDPTAAVLPAPKKIAHLGRAEALAFHPVEKHLAVAGGDADEVAVLDLADPRKALSTVRGVGRHITGVNLSEAGDVMGIRIGRDANPKHPNERGTGNWVRFDISRFTLTADANARWVDPIRELDGWKIVPSDKSRFVWYAERTREDGVKDSLRLGLDPDLDQAPTCYTFVPGPAGKPTRVLIGHYYGCSLFELNPEMVRKDERTGVEELPRSKLYTGHGGEVSSIVADREGKWFLTASADQTVAAWSLADWKSQAALGAEFAVDAGQLRVRRVDVGSPAWEAGLTAGDVIDLLAIDGQRFYERRAGKEPLGSAEAAREALLKPQSGLELFFGWHPLGAPKERRGTLTRLKQRPLWKWFPAFDQHDKLTDSIVWMWHGSYYYTASTHGDRLVGWHLNAPTVDGTPEFHTLERYKHLFLKPDVIARLIATRSVEKALELAQDGDARKRSFREVEPAPVDLALRKTIVRGEGVPITVTVEPQGNNPDLLPERIELWINDFKYEVWKGKGKESFKADVLVPASVFRAGDNQITALAINPARGRAEATRFVNRPGAAPKPALHGMAVGINDYSQHRKAVNGVRSFGDLGKARADADDFARELLTYRGPDRCFPEGGVNLYLDAAADRKSILAAFAELKKSRPRPDDLLILFFAGHGDLLTAGGRAPLEPASGRGFSADSGLFVFCCPNYSPATARVTALSGEELFEQLAEINCRKLILLDTCHAGGAIESNVLRRCIPNGQGPFVIAACDQSEKSYEDDRLGHGLFTYAVLEALGPKFRAADLDSDGSLTPEELFAYLSERVPALMRDVRPGNTQNPICFPQPSALPRVSLLTR
jgi:WD40 repeat protein